VDGVRVGVCPDLIEGCAPDVAARVYEAAEALAGAGAKVEEIRVPEFAYGLSAYYLIAPAEASSNLARYDGVRYGLRVDADDAAAMNTATRTAGFGAEVKRRIMLGTYALSAGYYDAYYAQAQRVRTMVMQAFERAYSRSTCCSAPRADHGLRPGRQGGRPDGHVHERRLHHPLQPGRAPGRLRALRDRATTAAGRRAGPGPGAGREALLFRVARVVEAARRGPGPRSVSPVVTAWEMVIGLEVHCELATQTKLFCGCRNAFGDEPNTNVCPVCLGLPGSLPVLNAQAVELAMRIGTALHCEIRPSSFARKNYFYPDQAKDYQISQYDEPINANGWLELPDGFRVGVTRAHMEEDTGKLTHVGGGGRINSAHHALVDYNRSGVPLVEIVSEPDMRRPPRPGPTPPSCGGSWWPPAPPTAAWRRGRCGSTPTSRCALGRPTEFGTRCEIKNLNSLRSLGRAIEYEAAARSR
jgi:hypothetical protein